MIIGVSIIGNINLYSFFFGLSFYIAGVILLIAGFLFIILKDSRLYGLLGVIIGILSLILGYLATNPFFVALIIGLFLIFYGITLFINNDSEGL